MDVEHVGGERDGAHLGDAAGAVAAREAEERVDAAHPRPGQRAVEERRGILADDRAGGRRLAAQRLDIAHRVDAALDGIIARIDRLAARRRAWMRFDQEAARVEADDLRIGARLDPLADIRMRNRVERLVDGGELIAPDLRIAPERDVVGRRRRRQQAPLLLSLKVLERATLGAAVASEASVIEAPVSAPRARLVERGQHFPSEAVVADAGHRALDAPFVPR